MLKIWIQDITKIELHMLEQSEWISRKRKERAKRLRNPEAKKASLAAEYLFQKSMYELKEEGMLPEQLASHPFPLHYEKNQYGAPYFPGNPLYFNWSHSGSQIALAVSDVPVGIDIQKKKKVRDTIAKRYYPKKVLEVMKRMEGQEKELLFFRYWTLLEAWLKAKGCGFHGFEHPHFQKDPKEDALSGFFPDQGFLTGKNREQWKYQFYQTDVRYVCCIVTKKCPQCI